MNNNVLVLNAAPKTDKLYNIVGRRNGHYSKDEILDTDVPGLMMAQEACHDLKDKYGSEYDVWIEDVK